ncbi:hypothetical protein GCM10027072_56490 [Streptomyces bullii]
MWERDISGVTLFYGQGGDGLLTADAGVAVALGESVIRGYGLADGAVRWTVKVTDPEDARGDDAECAPEVASATGGTTRVVVTCGGYTEFRSAWLVTLDNATGKELNRRALPVESALSEALVISADPFTLLVRERDERGVAAALSYGGPNEADAEPVTIPLTADEEDLAVVTETTDVLSARPALRAVVSGSTLVVAAAEPGADRVERVSGYSLADGRRRWHADLGTTVVALAPAGRDRVAVLGDNQRLWTFAAGDGARIGEEDGTTLREVRWKVYSAAQLLKVGDRWIVVNANGDAYPPALAVSPR